MTYSVVHENTLGKICRTIQRIGLQNRFEARSGSEMGSTKDLARLYVLDSVRLPHTFYVLSDLEVRDSRELSDRVLSLLEFEES